MNIVTLYRTVLNSRESSLHWCQSRSLIPMQKNCPECSLPMCYDSNRGVVGRWRCRKEHWTEKHIKRKRKRKRIEIEISAADGTWFSEARISLQKIFLLTYCWSRRFNYEQTITECHSIEILEYERLSYNTITDWFSFCRETIMNALDLLYEKTGLIGGEGHTVEIDETKVGKRKYNRGRMVEGSWIFGMIDIGTQESRKSEGDYRLEICQDNKRDEETLIPYIQKHVKPGTTIHSDCWKAYINLEKYGFKHATVNHSKEFVSVDGVHTQHIESSWRTLKRSLQNIHKEQLAEHICEHLWRRECKYSKKDTFNTLINDISRLYNPNV